MSFLFTVESPSQHFDRLVLDGTLHVTAEGFTWFCHVCGNHQPTEQVTSDLDRAWFDAMVKQMCEYITEDARSKA
jgi:hypothetical protein